MKPTSIAIALIFLSTLVGCDVANHDERPNIVLIVADDMAYSDIGSYGGEIETPNLDELAADGLRFLRFYNSAKCEPTRASLMSGRDWQDVGLSFANGPTMGDAMRSAGYRTLAVGKWHLTGNPVDRGFDRFFGHLDGTTDYFRGSPSHRLDDTLFVPPREGFYTTDANADFAIEFLEEAKRDFSSQPFFLYLAFNAPHGPLQAWPEDIARYRGRYRRGWDALRQERYARQLELGIVDPKWALPERPDAIPAWQYLSEEDQDFEDLRMATYAAMVDRMDQAIGRVIGALRDLGELENTLIVFQSDNGANPYDRQTNRHASFRDGDWNLGLGWAHATGTPFQHYKRNMFHGGNNTPCIVTWPGVIGNGGVISDQPAHIIDLMVTFLDVAGAEPSIDLGTHATITLPGKSLLPVFRGEQRVPHDALFFQLYDHRAVVSGNWKLVSDWGRPWQLFDMTEDRTETRDLSSIERKRVETLRSRWETWAKKKGKLDLRSEGSEPHYRFLTDG